MGRVHKTKQRKKRGKKGRKKDKQGSKKGREQSHSHRQPQTKTHRDRHKRKDILQRSGCVAQTFFMGFSASLCSAGCLCSTSLLHLVALIFHSSSLVPALACLLRHGRFLSCLVCFSSWFGLLSVLLATVKGKFDVETPNAILTFLFRRHRQKWKAEERSKHVRQRHSLFCFYIFFFPQIIDTAAAEKQKGLQRQGK